MESSNHISNNFRTLLENFSQNDLIDIVHLLTLEISQDRKKVLQSHLNSISDIESFKKLFPLKGNSLIDNTKVETKKTFDISKYRQRHIALHIQYDGGKYYGFASQQSGEQEDTVEKYLFDALMKLRLIESRKTCNYSRCGRTDKGVSALGQVVALHLRSNIPLDYSGNDLPRYPNDYVTYRTKSTNKKASMDQSECDANSSEGEIMIEKRIQELDYCIMLNKCLPKEIRVLGWSEVTPAFSARFSSVSRTYRYFFVRRNLDIDAMSAAASLLIGDHDFRNICKMDMANVTNFRREIYSAEIRLANSRYYSTVENGDITKELYMLEIKGVAFLWHMVRCIMSVLLLVGRRKEEPQIVSQLLDIERCPAKPDYSMAPELPLLLHSSGYENLTINYQPSVLWTLRNHYEEIWSQHQISACQARNAIEFLEECQVRKKDVDVFMKSFQKSSDTGNNKANLSPRKRKQNSSPSLEEVDDKHFSQSHSKIVKIDGKSKIDDNDELDHTSNEKKDNDMKNDDCSISLTDDFLSWKCVMEDMELQDIPLNDFHSESQQNGKRIAEQTYIPLFQRKTAETYDTRAFNMKGVKKERLNRHIAKKELAQITPYSENEGVNHADDLPFFAMMRKQGSV